MGKEELKFTENQRRYIMRVLAGVMLIIVGVIMIGTEVIYDVYHLLRPRTYPYYSFLGNFPFMIQRLCFIGWGVFYILSERHPILESVYTMIVWFLTYRYLINCFSMNEINLGYIAETVVLFCFAAYSLIHMFLQGLNECRTLKRDLEKEIGEKEDAEAETEEEKKESFGDKAARTYVRVWNFFEKGKKRKEKKQDKKNVFFKCLAIAELISVFTTAQQIVDKEFLVNAMSSTLYSIYKIPFFCTFVFMAAESYYEKRIFHKEDLD